jgi:hypothetical protein
MADEKEEMNFGDEPERITANERIRRENHPVVYTNFAEVGSTPWDIRVIFSQLGDSVGGKAAVTDLVSVVMTPALAKALVSVLNANLKGWEKENGEIQMPLSIKREAEKRVAEAKAKAESEAAKPAE